jgi:DNA-damage-inducible protein J
MPDNTVVRARIDKRTKRESAEAAKEDRFEPLKPGAETVAAMKAARRGKLVKVGKPDKLLRSLDARG